MVEPINLNKARKARAKTAESAEAAANRVKFGRSKLERRADAAGQAKARTHIDAHRLVREEPPKSD